MLGDVVPGLLFALGGLAVVDDLVEVDPVEPVRPGRHRPLDEVVVRAESALEHPVGLALEAADLLDRLTAQAALGLGEIDDVVVEGELFASVGDEVARRGHAVSGGGAPRAPGAGCGPPANSECNYRNSRSKRQRREISGKPSRICCRRWDCARTSQITEP